MNKSNGTIQFETHTNISSKDFSVYSYAVVGTYFVLV